MDNFKLPELTIGQDDPLQWDEDQAQRKVFKSAQFDCLPAHAALAVAMKNFWTFHYAVAAHQNLY